MNCASACRLMDSYLESRLGLYERQRLEMHLNACQQCNEELRRRSAFEQRLWQALGTAVQHRALTGAASAQIVELAQGSLRHAIRMRRLQYPLRAMAAIAAMALVVVGLLVWVGRISIPSEIGPITLAPVKQLFQAAQQPVTISPMRQPDRKEGGVADPSPEDEPSLSIVSGRSLLEPQPMHAGESFTLTVYLYSGLSEPADEARFDLEIGGPTGHYNFPLTMDGPVLAHRLTVLRLASDDLADLCQEKYLISPEQIFAQPGVYTVRVVLHLQ